MRLTKSVVNYLFMMVEHFSLCMFWFAFVFVLIYSLLVRMRWQISFS